MGELNKAVLPNLLKWADGYMFTMSRLEADRRNNGTRPRYLCKCGHGESWHKRIVDDNDENEPEPYYAPGAALLKSDYPKLPGPNLDSRPSSSSSTSSLA